MKNGRMQAKDLPDFPVLRFLASSATVGYLGATWRFGEDATAAPNSVHRAMPAATPEAVALAKMRSLMRRGLVSGCTCGCRGDFVLTDKGRAALETQL